MRRVGSVADALSSRSIQRTAGAVQTNLYPSPDAMQDWVDDDALYVVSGTSASILLRRDRDFFHVHLTFADPVEAGELLASLPADETYVADVVSRGDRGRPIVDVLAADGFGTHRRLRRLRRPPAPIDADPASTPVVADAADSEWVLAMLEAHFDRYSEQLPNARELHRAATNGAIILARVDGSNAAFLYQESTGTRSTLRYWFVAPEWRDARLGGRLLRHYLAEECTVRTSELWVVDDNDNAIKRYVHYGYESDVLTNHVMMRGAGHNGC